MRGKSDIIGLMGLVIVLALMFRFYDIQSFPPGLHGGESAWFTDTRLVDFGWWQGHVVSAGLGVVTVLVMYLATRVWFGRLAGVLAAFFLATSSWQVTVSRAGWQEVLVPLAVALFTAGAGLTVRATVHKRVGRSLWYAGLTGAVLAAGLYVDVIFWGMLLVILGIVTLLALASMHKRIGWPHFQRYGRQMAMAGVTFVALSWPLLQRLIQDTAGTFEALGFVTFVPPSSVVRLLREVMLTIFSSAEVTWLGGVPGFPLINSLVAVLFLLGLAWSLRGWLVVVGKLSRGIEVHLGMIYGYLLFLVVSMILPAVVSTRGVDGLSLMGLVVPVFMLAGCAGSVVIYWSCQRFKRSWVRAAGLGLVLGVLALSVLHDGALYFLIARNDAEAHRQYRSDLLSVVEYVNQGNADGAMAGGAVHIVLEPDKQHVLELLGLQRSPRKIVDPSEVEAINLGPGELVLFTASALREADAFGNDNPDLELVESRLNRFGREEWRAYRRVTVPEVEGTQDEEPAGDFGLDA